MNDRNNWWAEYGGERARARKKEVESRQTPNTLTKASWTITMDNFMRLDFKWITLGGKNEKCVAVALFRLRSDRFVVCFPFRCLSRQPASGTSSLWY
jgi:hypothetical protein